jgi:hypothetical protein
MQLRRHLGAAPRSTSSDRQCRHVVTACLVAEFLGALGLREVVARIALVSCDAFDNFPGADGQGAGNGGQAAPGAVRRVRAAAAAQVRQAGTVRVRLAEIPDSYTLVPLDQPTAFARSACSSAPRCRRRPAAVSRQRG